VAPTQHDKTRQITGHVLGQSALSNQRSALRSLRTCGVPMEHIGQALHCGIALAGNQQKTLIRLRSWFGRDETACTRAKSQSLPLFLRWVLTMHHSRMNIQLNFTASPHELFCFRDLMDAPEWSNTCEQRSEANRKLSADLTEKRP